ncbi:uncharacterized protein LOC125715915 isoform X3 [Brienomyrus brachyistius]|uniref:uncharacterized protein LOC125715915 isoform X3 n=1 Tax=Brienomyrus brachyistius TaxID=42636 RepID=UPI0020B417D7|nr:uncharacterized protein LOC125715915 isoform X3 [Brienomyrus brachyistius]
MVFAIREAKQESLGFSPNELVFGHSVRGPLKLLKEQFLSTDPVGKTNVLDYVSQFRERLYKARLAAAEALSSAQGKMKSWYDKKAVPRSFNPGLRLSLDEDGLKLCDASYQSARMLNSEVLSQLSTYLSHVTREQQLDIERLVNIHLRLFGDMPSQTTVIEHDIDVGNAVPIKQHAYRVNMAKRDDKQRSRLPFEAWISYSKLQSMELSVPGNTKIRWNTPFLHRFPQDFLKPFKLEVDASELGAGAVLLQDDGQGVSHPICFFGKKFDAHQRRYSTIEKETLAMLLALQHFDVYVGSTSQPVEVYTDHNPLVFLSRMYNNNQRLMRWALILQNYNIDIKHKRGCDNIVADALSRT